MKGGNIFIGTSGWYYKHWIGTFYPAGTKHDKQFGYYQQYFSTVEINNTFYRLPAPETFKNWRKTTADDFLFVVKASRYITHQKKLKEPKKSTRAFFKNVICLHEKLGPILFQLPPSWKVNEDRLKEFLRILPGKFRYVFEFRNPTWYTDEILALLRKYNCAICIYELDGQKIPAMVTADFVYLRLHGPGAKYQGSYTLSELEKRARQCRRWRKKGLDVFVYFDNDQHGYAPRNALTLKRILKV